MHDGFGARQREILALLQEQKDGLTIDDCVTQLGITRSAINQHLLALERDGLVCKAVLQKTGGRPGWKYQITTEGINRLPKQYSWFSELLLNSLKEEFGSTKLENYVRKVARSVAPTLEHRLKNKSPKEQVEEMAAILKELGYQAQTEPGAKKKDLPLIVATNCVYHDLAAKHPEVCQFDLTLLETLLGQKVEHQECMVKNGSACRFRFHSN